METSIQEYRQAVSVIKNAILHSQYRAAKLVTGEQLSLYFGIGGYVSAHSRQDAWGTSAIDRISEQLRRDLPGLRGFSARSIRNMRTFYDYWAQYLIWQPTAAKLQAPLDKELIDNDCFSLQNARPWRAKSTGKSFSATAEDMSEELRKALADMDEMRKLLSGGEE